MSKKTIFTIIIVIIFSLAGIFFGVKNQNQPEGSPKTNPVPFLQKDNSQQTAEIPATPQRIIIESLGVDAPIESVGQDQEGKMDVPKNVYNTAWYNLGYKPGELGNAVIAGHLDTQTGAPATFYYLSNLKAGDTITIVDAKDKRYTFKVTDSVTYNFDMVPLESIFGPSDKAKLNLITCDGAFDRSTRNYQKRLVVYSELDLN